MRETMLCVWMVLSAAACGGMVDDSSGSGGEAGSSSSAGGGGGGAASTTTAGGDSMSTTSTETPSEGDPFEETVECAGDKGKRWPLVPFMPDDNILDESGFKLNENGAIAVRCEEPLAYPARYDAFDFEAVRGVTISTNGDACDTVKLEAVWFPSDSLEVTTIPPGAHFADVDLSDVDWMSADEGYGERALVHQELTSPIKVISGYFCRGVVLNVSDAKQRPCVSMCQRPTPEEVEHDFYSDTYYGHVVCPDPCPMAPLGAEPTAELGPSFGYKASDLIFPASGAIVPSP